MEPRQVSSNVSSATSATLAADAHASAIVLDPNARLPLPVMLIWVCAFAGLAAYTASWFVPSLAR